MVELVDTGDLKSPSPHGEREFESRPGHPVLPRNQADTAAGRRVIVRRWSGLPGENLVAAMFDGFATGLVDVLAPRVPPTRPGLISPTIRPMDTPTHPRLGVGMIVGPILFAIAVGLMGVATVETATAPPGEFLPGLDWIIASTFVGLAGSLWCLVAAVVALTRAHDPARRWVLSLCVNLAPLAIIAAFIALTAWAA